MGKFWDLLDKSTLVSGIIALALVGTCCYLWATGQPVPDLLASVLSVVIGFFFGAKTQKAINARSVVIK